VRECLVVANLLVDRREVRLQLCELIEHAPAVLGQQREPLLRRFIAAGTQCRKSLHAGNRHAGRLQSHHESQPVDIGARIKPVTRVGTRHRQQQAGLLVVAQRMRRYAELGGHASDRERF